MVHAQVQSIRLNDFNYNPEYVAPEAVPIHFQLEVLNRVPEDGQTLDITVGIRYLEEETSRFLLSASCRTVYRVAGMTRLEHPDTGLPVVDVPEALLQQLTLEAVAHARALVAGHTAGTWFEQCHVALGASAPATLSGGSA
ncbi:hypothetical protein [Hymenobacter tenuis]